MKELPPKEAALFKTILKQYEHKQYKKGLKAAEQILKKFPDHGETLAMKGLFFSHLDRKEEAYDFVRKGLRCDLTSHICWHVFGLLYRADKNYEEAAKCYTHALKYDKDNLQILRDFSLLQIQMRNYEAYNDTRHQLLQLRPQNRPFWIGLAVSYHLLGKYDMAAKVLQSYEESLKETVKPYDFEHSELLMYHNMVIGESGDYEAALKHLNHIEGSICDKRAWKEKKAEYLLALNKLEEAEKMYFILFHENPDCHAYLDGILKCKGTHPREEPEKLVSYISELLPKFPRSNLLRRFPLDYTNGEQFTSMIDDYLRNALRKGVPSLFVNLKKLYQDSDKSATIETLMYEYLKNIKENGAFSATAGEGNKEPPTTYLWILYFLAQHHDLKGETLRALELIDEAIAHTPTLVELHMTKGRILKHGGDLSGAVRVMNDARELDLQDRFINSKCVKYLLRNNETEEAENTVVLFTKQDIPDRLQDLVDMQCMWFALESGLSYLRQGQFGRALKRFYQIERHFADIQDDQFDFHTYCLRKVTMRAYISMLRLEDQLRSHPYYLRAVEGVVECYLTLFDRPDAMKSDKDSIDFANMTESEKKKVRNKLRKAELKAQKEAEAKKASQQDGKKAGIQTSTRQTDDDPNGAKLAKTEDPLGDALKFLRPVQELAPKRMETWLMSFEIYIRQRRFLLALKSLISASRIDQEYPSYHRNLARFHVAYSSVKEHLSPAVIKVVELELPKLLGNRDIIETNAQYIKSAIESANVSIARVIAGVEAKVILDNTSRDEAASLLVNAMRTSTTTRNEALRDWIAAHSSLSNGILKHADCANEVKLMGSERFPLATYFKN
ncbi:uncharacterized protein VTP21DRAFT_7820 [Calcarisporiella thermophila]|uniref:uncharacterized protein n=1 Tax=Calcarisporiella thermophila TaxID=911321 RepID=UPI0037436BD1